MSSKPVLQVSNLCKYFRLYPRIRDRLKELVTGRCRHRNFQALKDISFSVYPGEALGIIGENGSGKSTLLKTIAGVLEPDEGTITSCGPITGLLELGTGFNMQLSGRRNIYLNGIYLNLSASQLQSMEERIVEFADLGQFIDEPLKTWSSGMIMRLGFAIAIHARPACFIIDEALSVGDASFQQKCFAAMKEYLANGGSVLFVSHDLNAIRVFCHRTMLLSHGQVLWLGDPETAVNRFYELLSAKGLGGASAEEGYGEGQVRFTNVKLENSAGKEISALITGLALHVRFHWIAHEAMPDVTFGLTIRDRFGQDMFGINTRGLNVHVDVAGAGEATFNFTHLNLAPGKYTISLAAHRGLTHLEGCYHWWDNAASFEVLEDLNYRFIGVTRLDATFEVNP